MEIDILAADPVIHQVDGDVLVGHQRIQHLADDLATGFRRFFRARENGAVEPFGDVDGGKKILFAFSNPAAAAADAIVRTEAKDILALVTDSGPFVQMARCSWNLLHVHYKVKLFPFGVPATAGLAALWGLTHSKDLQSDLLKLPANFPVLSIRGWEDPLVPVTAIDEAYAPAKNHLHYETLALPKGGHLNGLKDFPDEYKDKVSRFLIKVCSR
jgi:pimeloyl-ACP methyl ester carboxylesterase